MAAGIDRMESEAPEYVDGSGVLLGARVGGRLQRARMPTFNERLRQRDRLEAVAAAMGSLPSPDQAFEVIRIP